MTTGVGGRGRPYQGSRGLPRDTSRESRRPSASRSQKTIRGAPNLRANARPVGLNVCQYLRTPDQFSPAAARGKGCLAGPAEIADDGLHAIFNLAGFEAAVGRRRPEDPSQPSPPGGIPDSSPVCTEICSSIIRKADETRSVCLVATVSSRSSCQLLRSNF
jgi:hypothetical protein